VKKPRLLFLITFSFIVVLHGVFFLFALKQNHFYLQPDSSEYLNQRDNLLEQASMYQGKWNEPHRWYLETRRPPLTGMVLAIIKKINSSDVAILLFQNLLSCGIMFFLFRYVHKHSPDFNLLWLLPPLVFFPTQMIYTNFIMAEVLFQALIFAALLLLRYGKKNLTVFFLLLTLAAFVKPVFYLCFIPAAVALIIFRKKLCLKPTHFTGVVFMTLSVVLFSWFNHQRTGVFSFSSASESFIPDYVVLPVVQYAEGKEKAIRIHEAVQQAAQQKNSYPEYHHTLISESLQVIKQYPFTTALLWIKGGVLFFCDPGRWDVLAFQNKQPEEHQDGFFHVLKSGGIRKALNHLTNQGSLFLLFTLAGSVIHVFLFFCFSVFLKNEHYPFLFRLMAAVIVFYLALMTGPIGSARYRMAVFPVLLMSVPSGWFYLKTILEKVRIRS
jgi:hypothetical protein